MKPLYRTVSVPWKPVTVPVSVWKSGEATSTAGLKRVDSPKWTRVWLNGVRVPQHHIPCIYLGWYWVPTLVLDKISLGLQTLLPCELVMVQTLQPPLPPWVTVVERVVDCNAVSPKSLCQLFVKKSRGSTSSGNSSYDDGASYTSITYWSRRRRRRLNSTQILFMVWRGILLSNSWRIGMYVPP